MIKTRQLDRETWLLLLESGLFAVATALSSTFVNVYLWKIKSDWSMIAWFNLIHYLVSALTFIMAGWLAKRWDRAVLIRLGVAWQALFYLAVLWVGTAAARFSLGLGGLLGLGSGFFWLSYNVLYFEITNRQNRDLYNGINGVIGSVAGIAAPFVSGWIISRMNHWLGYRIIFGISLGIFLVAVLVSFFFPRRESGGEYKLARVLRLTRQLDGHWFWVILAMMAQGCREGVLAFLVSLLVYVTSDSEMALGSFYMVTSLVAFLAFYTVGKWVKPEARNRFILLGTVMLGIAILPFVFTTSGWSMWVFGIGSALFYPFYIVPLTSTVFDLIGETEETARMRVEFVVARELALNLGRIAGILLFVAWVGSSGEMARLRWFVLVIGFVQVLAWVSIRHVPVLAIKKEAAP
jgi:YQGE family putative transporter